MATRTSKSDVVVVGAGVSGAVVATMLGRTGLRVVLLDAADPLPYCFKAEKLSVDQIDRFRRLGLGTLLQELANRSRSGGLALTEPGTPACAVEQCGTFYCDLVNALRRQLPPSVDFKPATVRRIVAGPEQQQVIVEGGEYHEARLVVLASGRSSALIPQLNITKRMLSQTHSMAFGFTVAPRDRRGFEFEEFVYKADHTSTRIAFISLFRIGEAMRANMFAFWDAGEANCREFLVDPIKVLDRILPAFTKITGPLRLEGPVDRCPGHLQTVEGHVQPGVVLIGDAFQTNCPATGTGISKLLNDVECLCTTHIPAWFSTPGMDVDKIVQFYHDPCKTAYDRETLDQALTMRRMAVDSGIQWRLRRMARSWKRTAREWWTRERRSEYESLGT